MIILDATNEILQLVLTGAPSAQLPWTTSYVDVTTTTYTPGSADGTSNSAIDVDIVAAPTGSHQIQVKYISVFNIANAAVTVVIKKDTAGVDKILCKITLSVGDTLQYSTTSGFSVITSYGNQKISSVPGLAISAGTQSVSTGVVSFANSNGMTFGMDGSNTVTGSFSRLSMSFFEVPNIELNVNTATTNSGGDLNLSMQRVIVPYDITVTRLDVLAAMTAVGSTAGSWTISVGVYTRHSSAGSTLSIVSSTTNNWTWNALGASNNSDSYVGNASTRFRSIAPPSWAFTPGEYWFGFINSANGPLNTTPAIIIYGQSSVPIGGIPGGQNDIVGMAGVFSALTGAFPNSMNVTSDIVYAATAGATQSNINRQPYFRMFGTY